MLGKNFIYRHHIEPRSPTYVPREESFRTFKIYNIERNSSEKKCAMRDWRKAQTSEAKNKFNFFDIAGKGRNSVLHYSSAHEFVSMKRSQESSSLNSL